MYIIEVCNEQNSLEVDKTRLEEIVRTTLQQENVKAAQISVAVVDNPTIWRLNRRHLKHDYPTDVLSFLLDATPEEFLPGGPRGSGRSLEGEVIISAEMAQEMAGQYNWSAVDELTLYLVHGLLHLCGYDDLTANEQLIMRARERDVLRLWNLTPHYASELSTPVEESTL